MNRGQRGRIKGGPVCRTAGQRPYSRRSGGDMDYRTPDTPGPRDVFLSGLLATMIGGGFLFFLFLICGGLSFYVLAVVGGMAAVGLLHYLLWGYTFSEQVAGEREEDEIAELDL